MADRTASAAPSAAASRRDLLKGVGFKLLGVFLFGVMNALVKLMADSYPIMQLVFFRSALALLPLLWPVIVAGGIAVLKTDRPMGHVIRSLIGVAAMWFYFKGFSMLPLADANAILFAAPLIMTALSVPILGERVGPRRWAAVFVGFVGVLIMVNPTGGGDLAGALVCLAGAFGSGFAINFVRLLSRTEPSVRIVFWFSLVSAVVAGALAIPDWVAPSLEDLPLLFAIGIVGGLAQMCLTSSLRLAPVAVVVPFDYTGMIWAVLFGLLWAEIPGWNIWVGSAVVIASGLYIVWRETRVGRPEASPSASRVKPETP